LGLGAYAYYIPDFKDCSAVCEARFIRSVEKLLPCPSIGQKLFWTLPNCFRKETNVLDMVQNVKKQ
jgi:hypothetical protein